MRYAKGSIKLSESHDYPLLRQILRCSFATHSQLCEFMRLGGHEWHRHTFTWRIRRLVQQGLVSRRTQPAIAGEQFVYSIGASGALVLQGIGEYCLLAPGNRRKCDDDLSVRHSLELNEIHLTLLRSGVQLRWIPATDIRSQNELTTFGYAKDYDAVVEVRLSEARVVKFGLEYERTPKAEKDYRLIASRIEHETHLEHLLYLIPNHDLLSYVVRFFHRPGPRIYFGISRDWQTQLLDMPVVDASRQNRLSFREALLTNVFTLVG